MIALETSVVIALLATWHEGHQAVAAALHNEQGGAIYDALIEQPTPRPHHEALPIACGMLGL